MRRLFFVFFLFALTSAQANERILSFNSDVKIGIDASLRVTETIAILSEGGTFKRGILRDFPTQYKDRNGLNLNVDFNVLSVKRNGQDEPFSVESIPLGKRVRIGSADVFLKNGKHRYDITYTTNRQLGFFKDYDELYWNVTGNGWEIPIDVASVSIALPGNAAILSSAGYTGPFGAQGRTYTLADSGNVLTGKTTQTLGAREGFTVALSWPKGFIDYPSNSDKFFQRLRDNAGLLTLVLGCGLVGLYYVLMWRRIGRDPEGGQIIPLFTAPKNIGPAATRFIWRQSFDDRTFAAALVGLASLGFLKIADSDEEFSIERIKAAGAPEFAPEKTLLQALPSGITKMIQDNQPQISKAKDALESALSRSYEGALFNRNRSWFWIGALMSLALLALAAAFLPDEDAQIGLFLCLWSTLWWGITLGVGWVKVRAQFASRGMLAKITGAIGFVFIGVFIVGGFIPLIVVGLTVQSPQLYMFYGAAMLLVALNIVFMNLLSAPTVAGRKIMDEIEGFRLYLMTAEEERLNLLNPPEKTPELFEKYLPYALALDCEVEWNDKFAAVLAAAAQTRQGAGAPLWYSGSSWNAGRTSSFVGALGSTLTANVAAASTTSGSSSGGGFSGGGGGGGGGGGW